MRVRITRASYDTARAAVELEGSERSCECVMARAMREADPARDWRAGPTEATLEGDELRRWYGFSKRAVEVIKKFDSQEAGPEPYEEWEFEAFDGEEGTW